ncbi:MAG TPA: energy transducer TonB [Candidatus Acidoferrales bacterium]|nr:energy transducer TonB [Candidatus Acidoferrales bacterium]
MRLRTGIWGVVLAVAVGVVGASAPSAALAQRNAPTPNETAKRKVRSRVVPEYPALAKQMGLTGKVKVLTTISADGRVVGTKVVGGNPVLANTAIEALKKWRFESAPKETAEVIEFEFNGQN